MIVPAVESKRERERGSQKGREKEGARERTSSFLLRHSFQCERNLFLPRPTYTFFVSF